MLVFPQLVTGASALYPVTRTSIRRTVVNTLGDGTTDVYADPDAAAVAWELRASGLTRAEWDAIDALFQATSGMWQTFTLLDPTANLLSASGNLAGAGWTNGALIQLTAGVNDPFGTTRATRVINAGQADDAVAQVIAVPGNFEYCLSVWARTNSGSQVTLTQSTAGGNIAKVFPLSTQWVRIFLSGTCGQNTTSVMFGAQLAAGASVDLFGIQVEAQPGPSDYKETGSRGGVYSKARFADDSLTVTAQSTDVYDTVIRIVSTES